MAGTNGDAAEPMKKQTVMLPAQTGRSQTKKIARLPGKTGQPLPFTTDGRAPGRPDQIFSTLRADRHEGLGLKRLFFREIP